MGITTSTRDDSSATPEPVVNSREQLLQLLCPVCGHSIGSIDRCEEPSERTCLVCGFVMNCAGNIWGALAPSREEKFRQFIQEYQTVRESEGRGSSAEEYYLALPYKDVTGRNSWQWKIRRRSFRYFQHRILPKLETEHRGALDVLDIGAGNCWLSYRLALRGHRPVALDLLVNENDGLGAARHYFKSLPHPFPRFQAEMDRLPFCDGQFDLAIFNAAFHYSEDYERTLRECLRCLRPSGQVLILDSPCYRREESGRQMVEERRAAFEKKYGFRSDSIPSREYFTASELDALAATLGIRWKIFQPWYGPGWALRPLRARLKRRREPARFQILWGTARVS